MAMVRVLLRCSHFQAKNIAFDQNLCFCTSEKVVSSMTMSCQTELVQIHLTSYLISQQMNLKCNSHKCNIS